MIVETLKKLCLLKDGLDKVFTLKLELVTKQTIDVCTLTIPELPDFNFKRLKLELVRNETIDVLCTLNCDHLQLERLNFKTQTMAGPICSRKRNVCVCFVLYAPYLFSRKLKRNETRNKQDSAQHAGYWNFVKQITSI